MELSSSPFLAAMMMEQQSAQMSPSTPGTMSAKMTEFAFLAATESHMYLPYDPLIDAGDAPQVPAWQTTVKADPEAFSDGVDGSFGQAFLVSGEVGAGSGGANTSGSSHDYDEYRMDEDSESELGEDEDGEEEDGIVSHCDEESTPGPATPANRRTSARAARKNIKYRLTPSPPHTPSPSSSRKSSQSQAHARGPLVDLSLGLSSSSALGAGAEYMGETGHSSFLSVPCNNKRALDVAWSEELLDMPIPDLNKYIKSERLTSLSIKALKEARRRKKNRLYAQRSRSKKHTQGELLSSVQEEIGHLKHALSAKTDELRNLHSAFCVRNDELRNAKSALCVKSDELRNVQSALCVKSEELRNVRNCAMGLKEKCVKYERELQELRARLS